MRGFKVLWFGVIGEGIRMQASGLRVWGSRLKIYDLLFRVGVQGSGIAKVKKKEGQGTRKYRADVCTCYVKDMRLQ